MLAHFFEDRVVGETFKPAIFIERCVHFRAIRGASTDNG